MSNQKLGIFSPDSKFMNLMGKLVSLVEINLLWLFCCIPIVTFGAATTAMYACLEHMRNDEPCGVKEFFKAFAKNFPRATGFWLLVLLMLGLIGFNYSILMSMEIPGQMVIITVLAFFAVLAMMVCGMAFPLMSQFPGTLSTAAVDAILLSLAHLPKMILITCMNLLPIVILILSAKVFFLLGGLWIVCGFSLIAFWNLILLDKIFEPFREKAQ